MFLFRGTHSSSVLALFLGPTPRYVAETPTFLGEESIRSWSGFQRRERGNVPGYEAELMRFSRALGQTSLFVNAFKIDELRCRATLWFLRKFHTGYEWYYGHLVDLFLLSYPLLFKATLVNHYQNDVG